MDGKLVVRVIPNAAATEIQKIKDNVVHIRVAAPPDKNKANAELLKFLKKECGLKCRIKSGAASRGKVLELS